MERLKVLGKNLKRLKESCCCQGDRAHSGERFSIWLNGPEMKALRDAAEKFEGAYTTLHSLVSLDAAAEGLVSYSRESLAEMPVTYGQFSMGYHDVRRIRETNRSEAPDEQTFLGLPYQLANKLRQVLQACP